MKKQVKLSLFANDIIICKNIPKFQKKKPSGANIN